MDYKKLYEKAVERAKTLTNSGFNDFDFVKHIFPELKESEDEKIRKGIIRNLEYLMDRAEGFVKDELKERIAWLEKQGQTFTKKDVDDAYLKGVCDAKQELEKQGKQKPANKVEPKFKVKYADSEYNVLEVKDIAGVTFYGIEDEPNHIDYVKADNCEIISGYGIKEIGLSFPTKPVMFSEQKPAWSEEDEEMLEDTCRILSNSKECTTSNVRWLKSLKPQNRWKPSDKQIKAIKWVMDGDSPENWNITLKNLYQDLKKLKG